MSHEQHRNLFKDQVVLITGALAGIGRATAIAFAKAGAKVVASGRRDEEGRAFAAELRTLGAEAEFIRADVREDAEHAALVERALERFGHLDVAVNNAGTEGQPGLVTDQTAATYAATFDTNVLGTLLGMKHQLRVMIPQQRGAIVNVSSTLGKVALPYASVYAASKHAVDGLTKAAALEVAERGIRVNAVAPGPVLTDMMDRFAGSEEVKASIIAGVPLKRGATPDDIAQAILFLAPPAASFITGTILGVDGGKLA
jgi:NAD(P)-dependent dehydrogenase (short-subunit alcohol dehydrogenase family)